MLKSLLPLLVLATGLNAQIVGPVEVKAYPGRLATVLVTVSADSAEYEIIGSAFDAFREQSTDATRLRIKVLVPANARPGAEGYVVVAAVKDGKLLPLYKCKVTVAGTPVPPPPPVPPIPPVPPVPPPVDPLVAAIQTAAAADGMTPDELASLAINVRAAAGVPKAGQTAQRAHDLIKSMLSKAPALGKNMLKLVQDRTSRVLNDLLSKGDAALDASTASQVADLFNVLAAGLEGASK